MQENPPPPLSLSDLKNSEALFESLLESAPDAMIIVDGNGTIVLVNGLAETMFGYPRKMMLGNSVDTLLPERLRPQHAGHRRGYLHAPGLRPMGEGLDLLGQRADGTEFPVEISLSPINTEGRLLISSVIRDVTQRKELEEQLIASRREAERANKANSAFLAAASHDLRQPVQALMLLNGALRRTVTDQRALGMLDSQNHSLLAMTNLLNSLLDISRLDAGAVTPNIEDFLFSRITDRLGSEFGRQAADEGLRFEVMPCSAVVRSDPGLLAEIIQNFVSNAIRYTSSGEVRLETRRERDHLCIEVIDTGIGIAANELEAIFNEFHQVSPSGADKQGFGLGLAIARRLADLLGHEIRVESQPGKGSVFSIVVPMVSQEAEPAAPIGSATNEAPTSQATGCVLIIEDDTQVANAWALLLESAGYTTAIAASRSDVIVLLRQKRFTPDLILSDYHLLDESTGVEAVREVRNICDRDIPAFIVSGDTSRVIDDARTVRNSILMSKPVDPEYLLSRASAALSGGSVNE